MLIENPTTNREATSRNVRFSNLESAWRKLMANNFENAKSELKQIEYIKENHGLWSEEAKACYIAIREYYTAL